MKSIEDLLKELDKKPETFKEKLEDLWLDLKILYEKWFKDPYYGLKNYFRNLIRYSGILWSDRDWDYDFFLNIQEKKLEFMEKYHKESGICTENPWIASRIKIARSLLRIIREEDEDVKKPLFWTPHVNTKNAKRFHKRWDFLQMITEGKEDGIQMAKYELRKEKAWILYYRCLEQYLRTWWD